jgi:hypothetical protein
MKGLLLLLYVGALICLTSCSKGRVVIPAHPIHPNFQPLVTSSVVFQLGQEPFSLNENVYYSGNIEISASNPLRDSIVIDLSSGSSWSGNTRFSQGGTAIYHYRGNPFEFNNVTATVIYSGDTISGSFSGTGYSSTGDSIPFPAISGTFSNVPPQQ